MSDLDDAAWERLERHLIATGRLSPEGIGRRARPTRCRTCKAPTLVGLDDETCALRADADPRPITALGEALAHLEDRRTYALVPNAGRLVLDYRDAGRITHRPAGHGRYDVLVEHSCNSATRFPTTASFLEPHIAAALPEGAPCPF